MSITKYSIFHFIFSITFITFFVVYFGYPYEMILVHLSVLTIVNLMVFSLLKFFVSKFKNKATIKWVNAILVSVYWALLLFLYGINWMSNLLWGGNVMAGFLTDLPKHIDSVCGLYNFPHELVYLLLVIFYISLVLLIKKLNLVRSKQFKYNYKLVVICLFLSSSYLVLVSVSNHLVGKWGFEPILSAFSKVNATYNSVRSSEQRIKDHIVREKLLPQLRETDSKTSVILIMADALRADHMPIYGYERNTTPFLSSINESLQKLNTFTSTCSESVCGILSTLASREFFDIGFGMYDFSDVLKDAGFKKYFLLSANHHWNNLADLYGDNHDVYLDGSSRYPKMSMYDDEAVIMNLKELPDMDESPGMFYFHLVSTHEIGVIKPENELFKPFSRDMSAHAGFEKNELSDNDKQRLINGYDNGIFQLDKYIRDIFLVLKEKGYLEDAIVIITSDHGDGIGERGYYYHTYQLYQEDISIPLLVYDTSNRCQLVNTRYGTHIDIAPTVLDCLGLPMVSTWQGRSLLKQPAKNRFTFHQTIRNKEEFALIKEDGEHMYKLMASRVRNELYNLRLFEIYSDPHEKNDLMKSADSELVNEMMTVLNLKIQK